MRRGDLANEHGNQLLSVSQLWRSFDAFVRPSWRNKDTKTDHRTEQPKTGASSLKGSFVATPTPPWATPSRMTGEEAEAAGLNRILIIGGEGASQELLEVEGRRGPAD